MAHPLSIGSNLGRFQLEKLLGAGATAAVFLARDTELNIQVALKVLAPVVMSDEEALKRLRREIVLVRSVVHPGICRVFDLNHDGDVHFISMEYIPGATLAAILKEEGVLDVFRAVRLARALCRALRAAHKAGIVHRDLKPANVIVTQADRPVLMDFGFAATKDRDVAPITSAGAIVGTLHYMAPEVLQRQAATPESDQYSLAVTLYEAVTGRMPFTAASPFELKKVHETSHPVSPVEFNSQISEDLAGVMLKALSVSPAERFKGVDRLEQALAELVLDQAVDASDASVSAPWDRNLESISRAISSGDMGSDIIRDRIKPTTVFFSDIVGITPFFDQYGDVAGRKRLQTHHRILLPLVQDHDGVVVKTIGDAIMAVFPHADDAVAAALDMQTALQEHNQHVQDNESILVRMGMHSGNAIVERKDVFGDTVNVTARICSKATGGQILVSAATAALLTPGSVKVTSFSRTELKGKRGVFELFEVTRPGFHDHDTFVEVVDNLALQHGRESFGDERTEKVLASFPAVKPSDIEPETTIAPQPNHPATFDRAKLTVSLATAGLVAVAIAAWLMKSRPPDSTPPIVSGVIETFPSTPPPVQAPRQAPEAPANAISDKPARRPTQKVPDDSGPSGKTAQRALVSNIAAVRRQAQEARATFESQIREKGLISGDNRDIDAIKLRLADLMRHEQYVEAVRVIESSQRSLSAVVIDRAFVQAKMSRFNVQFDATQDGKVKQRVQTVLESAVTSFQRGDLETANRNLNRGFDMLASSRR